MITIEDLRNKYNETDQAAEPLRVIRNKAQQDFEENLKVLSQPFIDMQQLYFNQKLLDKNGVPVLTGATISDEKNKYSVTGRGLQIIFGNVMDNPQLFCKKLNSDNTVPASARIKYIHPSELKGFEIITI